MEGPRAGGEGIPGSRGHRRLRYPVAGVALESLESWVSVCAKGMVGPSSQGRREESGRAHGPEIHPDCGAGSTREKLAPDPFPSRHPCKPQFLSLSNGYNGAHL